MTVIVVKDRFYVPLAAVNMDAVRRLYEVPAPTKAHCRSGCRLASNRNKFCGTCPGKDHKIKLWELITLRNGARFIAVPAGAKGRLRDFVRGPFSLRDLRPIIRFRSDLRWNPKLGGLYDGSLNAKGDPTPNQKQMVGDFIKAVRAGGTGGLIISPPRCVTGDTLVMTSEGLTRIGDWAPAKKIGWHSEQVKLRGRWVKPKTAGYAIEPVLESGTVVRASDFWTSAPERVIRVVVRGGLEVKGTFDHPLWMVNEFKPLRDVRRGDAIAVHYGQNVWGKSTVLTPDVARLLGFWVSEGTGRTHEVHVTNYDDAVRAQCRVGMLEISSEARITEQKRRGADPRLGLKRCVGSRDRLLVSTMNRLTDGLWRKSARKIIPRSVLESPRHIVREFLRALFEGDGSVSVETRRIEYTTISPTLVAQLRVVLANMGIVTKSRRRMTWAPNGSAKQVSKPSWTLTIAGRDLERFEKAVGFFSQRKRKALSAVVRRFNSMGHHQPTWYDYYPVQVRDEFVGIVAHVDEALSVVPARRHDGCFTRWPVSFASIMGSEGEFHIHDRPLTRNRLVMMRDRLSRSPHWYDLTAEVRGKVLSFFDVYLRPNVYWTTVSSVSVSRGRHVTYDLHVPDHHRFMANGLLQSNSGKCVTGGTLVMTDRGLHPIAALFADADADVHSIGKFGRIATPTGWADVRGRYSKVVDSTVVVRTSLGASLEGTPEHPISVVTGNGSDRWRSLSDVHASVQRQEVVRVRYPSLDLRASPNGAGLSDDEATVLGFVFAYAHKMSVGPDRVTMDDLQSVVGRGELTRAMRAVAPTVTVPSTGQMRADRSDIPLVGAHAVEGLYASGFSAWRAFLRPMVANAAAFADGLGSRVGHELSLRLPESVARRVHFVLLGAGVRARLTESGASTHVTADETRWLEFACEGRTFPPVEDFVVDSKVLDEKRRVYDLMVPEGRAFIANGLSAHNTVLGVAVSVHFRLRTFITASQIDFLRQFGKRFGERTNLRELYRRGERPVVLVDPKGWKDGPTYGVHVVRKWGPDALRADVVMAAYQQFINPDHGEERLRQYVRGKFSLVEGDEIHKAAAPAFSRVVNRLDTRIRLGLTATPERTDHLEPVVEAVIGPVVSMGRVTSTLPKIELFETGVQPPREYKQWNSLVKFLSESEARNLILVRQCFKDLRTDRRNCILIPVVRRAHVFLLIKMINAQAEYNRRYKREDWPTELAVAYLGGADTNAVLNQVGAGRARVVIAMTSMVIHGLDVDRWTHVYANVIPTSSAPNVYQMGNRVCTPYLPETEKQMGDKPQPLIRYVIDATSASVFCFAKVFNYPEWGLDAGITANNRMSIRRYKIDARTYEKAREIARFPKSYSPADSGVAPVLGKTRLGKDRTRQSWSGGLQGLTRF